MERKKHLLTSALLAVTLLLTFSPVVPVKGSSSDYKSRIYNFYINGNMAGWEGVVREIELSLKQAPGATLIKNELLGYYYGLAGYLISQKEKKRASAFVAKGESIIAELLAKEPGNANTTAYQAAFLGFRIGINNLRAMTLGMKSADLSKAAYLKDSLDPQVVTERANVLYYSPSFAGGNKQEAMRLYQKAVLLLEQEKLAKGNWFYLSLLTNIARLLEESGDMMQAEALYKKILQTEPGYRWVRDELYPSLQSRL
mgnify:CR=1 FL=1